MTRLVTLQVTSTSCDSTSHEHKHMPTGQAQWQVWWCRQSSRCGGAGIAAGVVVPLLCYRLALLHLHYYTCFLSRGVACYLSCECACSLNGDKRESKPDCWVGYVCLCLSLSCVPILVSLLSSWSFCCVPVLVSLSICVSPLCLSLHLPCLSPCLSPVILVSLLSLSISHATLDAVGCM